MSRILYVKPWQCSVSAPPIDAPVKVARRAAPKAYAAIGDEEDDADDERTWSNPERIDWQWLRGMRGRKFTDMRLKVWP